MLLLNILSGDERQGSVSYHISMQTMTGSDRKSLQFQGHEEVVTKTNGSEWISENGL